MPCILCPYFKSVHEPISHLLLLIMHMLVIRETLELPIFPSKFPLFPACYSLQFTDGQVATRPYTLHWQKGWETIEVAQSDKIIEDFK